MLKIPFFRLGTWKHPKYGTIEGTQEMFDVMTDNFRKQSLGRDPFIRIGHDKDGQKTTFGDAPAEGWIKDLVQEGPILFAVADPTNEEVVEDIKSKRYRFASAEYDMNYLDKESGQRIGPVLSAVSLTNEPFLTKLPEAVVLSDPPETFYMDYEEVEQVDFKQLGDKLEENNGLLKKLADGFADFFGKFKAPEVVPPVPGKGIELPDDIKAKLAAGEEAERKLAEQAENEKKGKLAEEKTKLADLKTSIETRGNTWLPKVLPRL